MRSHLWTETRTVFQIAMRRPSDLLNLLLAPLPELARELLVTRESLRLTAARPRHEVLMKSVSMRAMGKSRNETRREKAPQRPQSKFAETISRGSLTSPPKFAASGAVPA